MPVAYLCLSRSNFSLSDLLLIFHVVLTVVTVQPIDRTVTTIENR